MNIYDSNGSVRRKPTPPFTDLDSNIVTLVRILTTFPGLWTDWSCGGDENPEVFQCPANSWTVGFRIGASQDGWLSLELLAWVGHDYRALGGLNSYRLEVDAHPPF